jgi:CHAD domain-containing protein
MRDLTVSIVQIRKAAEKNAKKLKDLYHILKDVEEDELADLIGDMEDLGNNLEENLDALYEKDTLDETQETRKEQYELLKEKVDEILPELIEMRDAMQELQQQFESLEEIAENELN